MDSSNQFEVVTASQPGRWSTPGVEILKPVPSRLAREEAFRLGIWLVAMSECDTKDIVIALTEIAGKGSTTDPPSR